MSGETQMTTKNGPKRLTEKDRAQVTKWLARAADRGVLDKLSDVAVAKKAEKELGLPVSGSSVRSIADAWEIKWVRAYLKRGEGPKAKAQEAIRQAAELTAAIETLNCRVANLYKELGLPMPEPKEPSHE